MDKQATRSRKFPAQFESLDHIREFVGSAAQDCGLDSKAVYQVQLAVDEASSNIIEHAYGGPNEQLQLECSCQLRPDELEVTLSDCGRPFNPDAVAAPDLDAELQERPDSGLGLFFMHQLMDEVDFTFVPLSGNGQSCNLVRMVKRKEK
jgi:anti-sigma regulatory factor (Ser/Thr protein kinase)